jgi:steroid delta-isomerase-like uncharacterized protein
MTSDEIRTFVRVHKEAIANGDVKALADEYAEDGEVISPLLHTVRGRQGIEESWRSLFRAFSNLTLTVEDLIIEQEGDGAAAFVFTWQATHAGDALGFPASGRRFTILGVNLMRFRGDKIVYDRRIYDFTDLLLQIGVLKAKTAS